MSSSASSPTESAATTPSSPPPVGFSKWLNKVSLMTGIGSTPEQSHQALREYQCKTCESWKSELMQYSPSVVFMLKHLRQTGTEVSPQNLVCQPCDLTHSGGFSPDSGQITLCAGQFFNKSHMETTIVHELIHLYDHCKFKVDWGNLRHHACSEIRANSLSGDCRYTRELRRGFTTFSKQHQACVRRRAVISVAANPACPSQEAAEKAVNEVWESCFADTRPFDEIY